MTSEEHPDYPEKKGLVRMFCYQSALVYNNKVSPDITELCEISICEMKGKVPSRLINMIMASEYHKEFLIMYQYITKNNIKS